MSDLKKKILRLFYKHGGDGERTKSFEDFPLEVRESVLRSAGLSGDEIPILLVRKDQNDYLLITDSRLVAVNSETRNEIPLAEISWVAIPDKDFTSESKKNWKRLEITYSENVSECFEIEEGRPFFGVWNALLFIASRNKRPQSAIE